MLRGRSEAKVTDAIGGRTRADPVQTMIGCGAPAVAVADTPTIVTPRDGTTTEAEAGAAVRGTVIANVVGRPSPTAAAWVALIETEIPGATTEAVAFAACGAISAPETASPTSVGTLPAAVAAAAVAWIGRPTSVVPAPAVAVALVERTRVSCGTGETTAAVAAAADGETETSTTGGSMSSLQGNGSSSPRAA
jgi:hypothetical protein